MRKNNKPTFVKVIDSAIEPVSLADMKLHLRVDGNSEDTVIASYQKAARNYCEEYTGRAFINQTWRMKTDDFPLSFYGDIELNCAPLSSITSITYIDVNGVSQTLSTDIYEVDTDSIVGKIRLKYNQSYPSVRDHPQSVTINYVVGYGDSTDDVPEHFIHAIKLLTSHFYESREPVSFNNNMYELPFSVKALLDINRVYNL
jgi:uncharacterized phiE125 gp8 family phage protein